MLNNRCKAILTTLKFGLVVMLVTACSPTISPPSGMQAQASGATVASGENSLSLNPSMMNASSMDPTSGMNSGNLAPTGSFADPTQDNASSESPGESSGPDSTQALSTTVDCNEHLPCVGAVDNGAIVISLQSLVFSSHVGELLVVYQVKSSRDTNLQWEKPGDSQPDELQLIARKVDGTVLPDSESSTPLLAGTATLIEETYRLVLETSSTVVDYRLTIQEADQVLAVFFNNVPVNHVVITNDGDLASDCQQQLPCRWQSPEKNATVTVVLVERIYETNELIIVYYVEVNSVMNVIVGQSSLAIDNTGTEIESNLHTLNDISFTDTAEQTLQAGSSNRGIVDFKPQLATDAQVLNQLTLDIVVQGYRPVYQHVPWN